MKENRKLEIPLWGDFRLELMATEPRYADREARVRAGSRVSKETALRALASVLEADCDIKKSLCL